MPRYVMLCLPLAPLVASAAGIVSLESGFENGIPPGWTASGDWLASPEFPADVLRVDMTYGSGAQAGGGTAAVYALRAGETGGGACVANLNTLSSGASLSFPEGSGFRSFRIETAGAFSLSSFSAEWYDAVPSAPAAVRAGEITESSFELSWEPSEGAAGYVVRVWTNVVTGASEGIETWVETFDGLDAGSSQMSSNAFSRADHVPDWSLAPRENVYMTDSGAIRLGLASKTSGRILVPHVLAEGENALRLDAWRYGKDDGQSLSASLVSADGAGTNLVGVADLGAAGIVFDLPAGCAGSTVLLESVQPYSSKDHRVAVSRIAFVSGRSAGAGVPDVLLEKYVPGRTSLAVDGMPSVPVCVSVCAAGEDSSQSPASETLVVDLSNPPARPVLNALAVSSLAGRIYSQGFDGLAGLDYASNRAEWLNGVTLPYWQAYVSGDAAAALVRNQGTATVKGLYALYEDGAAAGAIGALASGGNPVTWGIAFTNDTSSALVLKSVSYSGRQWGFNNTAPQTLKFECLVTNSLVSVTAAGGWTTGDGWSFVTPSSGGAAPDLPPPPAAVSISPAGVKIPPGHVAVLRWTLDPPAGGKSAMVCIDDLEAVFGIAPETLVMRIARSR